MKIFSVLFIIAKAICVPLISMVAVNKWNVIAHLDFLLHIQKDKQFDLCLTVYLAVAEGICTCIEKLIQSKSAKISCVFYTRASEKNEKNIPRIVCSTETAHVAKIFCDIEVTGNLKAIRKESLELTLPEWVSSQIPQNETVLKYNNQTLIWSFKKLIPENTKSSSAKHTIEIPFIDNMDEGISSVCLQPQRVGLIKRPWIGLNTNKFELCNREE